MKRLDKDKWTSNLSNKYIFVGLIILSIAILSGINNYYFYAHIARENGRNAEKIKITVNKNLAFCAENNIDISSCTHNIVSTIDKVSKYYYYVTEAVLEDSNGNIIWRKDRNNHDKVAALNVLIRLPDLINSTKAEIKIENHWSNANILLSVYRSMTFSANQLIDVWSEEGFDKAKERFSTVAWYRSRPAIGFTIFTIFLFFLYRRRERAVETEVRNNDREYVKLEKERIAQENKNKGLRERIDDLESKENNISKKIKSHDGIINPPLNTLKYDQFLELDPESVILKCRKVSEKLIIQIYNKHIRMDDRIPFYKRIEQLSKEKLIDSKIVSYINTIKAFGNISAHPNVHNPIEFTREDAIMVSNALILLIDELESNNLLTDVHN